MKRKIIICLLAAALCALSAGCGAKPDESSPSVPQTPPEVQEPSSPEPQAQPESQEPAAPQPEVQDPPASQAPPQEPSEVPEPSVPEPAPVQAPEPAPEPEPAPAEEAVDLTGIWRDNQQGTSGGRCYMEITGTSDEYTIDIYWGSSARETHHWQLFGAYDEAARAIPYIGTHFLDTTLDNGNIQQTVMLKGLAGTLALDGTGALLWTDDNEQTGEGMIFEREA